MFKNTNFSLNIEISKNIQFYWFNKLLIILYFYFKIRYFILHIFIFKIGIVLINKVFKIIMFFYNLIGD